MAKYTTGELHANGETLSLDSHEDVKNFRSMSGMKFFKSSDGTKEFGFSDNASMFAVLTIDQSATPLAPKPNCDNYGTCPETPEPDPEP